ncbi:MAG: carbohydrate binding domain-containing protein [Balneolales bacterium]|nr:carbohydrate binding domain-containing protein [Balneolales bacterium]
MNNATKVFKFLFAISLLIFTNESIYAQNVLTNSDFETGDLTDWTDNVNNGASATFGVTNGAATITNIVSGSNSWNIQLYQELTTDQINSLVVGETYVISFDASASGARSMKMFFGQEGGSFTEVQGYEVDLGTEMGTYSTAFVMSETFSVMKLAFEVGLSSEDVTIDNVELRPAGNLLTNGDFNTGTLDPWSTFINGGTSATIAVNDNRATVTGISGAGGASWHIQLNQAFSTEQIDTLEPGQVYTIEFDAWASSARHLRLFFGEDGGNFNLEHDLVIDELATDSTRYSTTFMLGSTYGAMKLSFEAGLSDVDFTIDNVVMFKGGELAEPSIENDFFANFTISSGAEFAFGMATIGEEVFIDRTHTFTSVPSGFVDATTIMGSNDDKGVTDASGYVTFNVKQDMTLYLAYDNRGLETLPAWFTDWTQTEYVIETSDVDYTLFSRAFTNGDLVDIGGPAADPQVTGVNGIFFLADDGQEIPDAEPLGDSFNFFVEAVNVNIPETTSLDVTEDTSEVGNTVLVFDSGNWNTFEGFEFPEGVDMSANRMEGDTLFFRLKSDPGNLDGVLPKLMILDSQPEVDNFDFRLVWEIPVEMHDAEWHDIALPLPPATKAELDSAKVGKNVDGTDRAEGPLDELSQNWVYEGSFGGSHSIGSEEDEGWREFNWNRVVKFGVFWSQNSGVEGNIVLLDDIFIGNTGDLQDTPPAPAQGLAAASSNSVNTVSWNSVAGAESYTVYFSGDPITDLSDSTVFFWDVVDAQTLSVEHSIISPHPNDPTHEYYYAVTATNAVGVENTDAAITSVMATGDPGAYVYELTPEQTTAMITALENEEIVDLFPTDRSGSFVMNKDNSPHPSPPDSDSEFSGMVKVAYGDDAGDVFFFVYLDVNDDELVVNPIENVNTENEGLSWNSYKRDQVEFRLGTYETNFVTGSTHIDPLVGEETDLTFNYRPVASNTEKLDSVTGVWISYRGIDNYNTQMAFQPLFEYKMDENENVIGYRGFFAISNTELRAPFFDEELSDFTVPLFTPPTGDEFGYYPFTLSLIDDRNDGRSRSWENTAHQLFYSFKPNFTNNYWNNPQDLSSLAFTGVNVVPVSTEDISELTPKQFRLDQNYPNPFNPSTKIQFELPSQVRVNLTVYNVLGQKVMTLLENQSLAAGLHSVNFNASALSSGMYIYRIEAGEFVSTKKMMLIK